MADKIHYVNMIIINNFLKGKKNVNMKIKTENNKKVKTTFDLSLNNNKSCIFYS